MSTESDSPAPAPAQARQRPRRCNADPRWTAPEAIAFLAALARCGQVAEAARAVGMSRQAAYRLKARLAGGQLGEGFGRARREGSRARAAASRSRWEGPGLDALARPGQGYAAPLQSDACPPKVTQSGPS